MRAQSQRITHTNESPQSPLLSLVSSAAPESLQREGYAAAESIMRSAARAKRQQRFVVPAAR